MAPKGHSDIWRYQSQEQDGFSCFSSCEESGTGLSYTILAVRGKRSSNIWKNLVKGSFETKECHKIHFAALEKLGLWYILPHIMKITVKPSSFNQLLQMVLSLPEGFLCGDRRGTNFFPKFILSKKDERVYFNLNEIDKPIWEQVLEFCCPQKRSEDYPFPKQSRSAGYIRTSFSPSHVIQPTSCGQTHFHLTLSMPQVLLSSHNVLSVGS